MPLGENMTGDHELFCWVRNHYKHFPITHKNEKNNLQANILQVVYPATAIYTFKHLLYTQQYLKVEQTLQKFTFHKQQSLTS